MGCISSASESVPEKKTVLLGKSGDGKSSAGNTILGEKVFNTKASASTAGEECQKAERKVHGRNITVIDTPGDFEVKEEHVLKHTVILFTHGEQLEGETIEAFMEDCPQLQELVDKCGGRCHVIDSKYWNKRKRGNKSNRVQVKNLLKTIDKMVNENGCYTNELLQNMEKDIQEEMKNITEDKLHPEEQREEAKKNVHASYLKKSAGMTIGTVLGALFGIGVAVALIVSFLKPIAVLQTAIKAAGVGAGAGKILTGVLGVGGFIGAVGGATFGYEKAVPLCDMITKTAVQTWDNGYKKVEEMCGLNSKMVDLH
ncbi:GTPase IMAP family member 7-like isoform X3 [Ctenopharyngodon idella]|uniref:GTPase IMAP family member 7-like isoform X3 n=1 Tax=Ctenopharyngodon idella TaxID=7959 RepID=UPI00222F8CB3|nr:GTPase IMAP family member 7-like isoform X3 [Ctenopharyngodon idella]